MNKNIKVCILTTAHSPFDERIFYKEARSLHQAGYGVTIIAPYAESKTVEGIDIVAVPPFASRKERITKLWGIYHKALEENADIYHFHDPDLIVVGLLLRRRGKQVIYDVHEYYGDSLLTRYWLPKPVRKIAAVTFDRLEKWAAGKFSAVVVVNSHMQELFLKVNSSVEILHNYPLESQFAFPRPDICKENPVVLYLGGINRERGLEVILRAMSLVKENYPTVRCQLVGPVDTADLSPEFENLAQWLSKGNVELVGKVPYDEVPGILQASSIALVPLLPTLNYQKAIPVKLLEYMAAGLPVIGAGFGYIEQILRKNDCGVLFEAGNHQELAAKICQLLADPYKGLYYGQQGWEAFHREYTWESEQEKLLHLYSKVQRQE